MDYAYEERIGNPDLFTGRKQELAYFLKWNNDIKEKKSQSTALLARRQMGKTALMERLFNITFFKNDGVIPFYYEIKEEISQSFKDLKQEYKRLKGKYNYHRGRGILHRERHCLQ